MAEAQRRIDRRVTSEKVRVAQANEVITRALGKLERSHIDRPSERVTATYNTFRDAARSSGRIFFESVSELDRIRRLIEAGLEHERTC